MTVQEGHSPARRRLYKMMSKAPISIGIQPQTAMFAVLFTAVCGAGTFVCPEGQ